VTLRRPQAALVLRLVYLGKHKNAATSSEESK